MQTFRKLREEDCYYVDKTPYIERLLDEGSHYFLSRPRRFGKRLFLDTLKELFEGNQALFAGLAIHDRHDWTKRHPVVRLDMAVRADGHVYLFEFKVVEMAPPGSAMAQLRERGYADKYRGRGEPIHLIGVEFSRQTRNVTAFEVAGG